MQNGMFILKTSQFKLLLFILFSVTCDTVEVLCIILESRNQKKNHLTKVRGSKQEVFLSGRFLGSITDTSVTLPGAC